MRAFQRNLLGGAAALALIAAAGAACAEDINFNIAPQSLASALNQFGAQSDTAVLVRPDLANAKMTKGVNGAASAEVALNTLLDGTGLTYRREGDTFLIVSASDPQSGSAAGDGADGTVAALIVTAQKKEEAIQDVPIAISAFTEKSLEEQKIEGGFDLLKAIPNVTFSKNNFTSYNFSIRGIGTKAVSATTDPGVAVSFNNIALLQNRLFEQEYFDVERVEVLRGPQGTLYGRNATAGVINVISAKPNLKEFNGWVKGEVGNYHAKRLSAMVNVPLIKDKLAVRFAGSLTNRQGYDYNTGTNHAVNGRDLWSGRVTVQFNPTEHIRSNLVWERFNEDDNRSRTGKQLCKRDNGPDYVRSFPTNYFEANNPDNPYGPTTTQAFKGILSQGCSPVSLYDPTAFETPNGMSIPFIWTPMVLGNGVASIGSLTPLYTSCPPEGCPNTFHADPIGIIGKGDPYAGLQQSPNLRVINSFRDPIYRAHADILELNIDWDVTDDLTFSSQTAYNKDRTYSFQDYNRFNTVPIFTDTAAIYSSRSDDYSPDNLLPKSPWHDVAPGGVFCDPQLGCSKSLAGFDIAKAVGSQFAQEVRLQSSWDGPVNFSVGANYTRFTTRVDYYVFFNLLTLTAMTFPFNVSGGSIECGRGFPTNPQGVFPFDSPQGSACPYIDPSPVESVQGDGHNYFRSQNPYKLKSAAVFGEVYWQVRPSAKVTMGIRYTDDRKTFTPIPTQVLLGNMNQWIFSGGLFNRGFVADPDVKQHWGELTGRLGFDWKPDLSFTDQTMIYAFYSRGYKGGGANPPRVGFAPQMLTDTGEISPTFRPEFVNAYEVGAKNTLLDGAMIFNTDAFFYDYKDYQVSQIRERTAVNENFDAKTWGLEFQAIFAPDRNLQVIANLGYLDTAIGDGMKSIDIMNRTQGNPDYVIFKPFPSIPSNCVVPAEVVEYYGFEGEGAAGGGGFARNWGICNPHLFGFSNWGGIYDPAKQHLYTWADYPEINNGAGLYADLSGNELPNAPHWTTNVGVQYGFDMVEGWRATIRGDAYWQSQSWARVFNAVNDKLHGWYNANLSLWLEKPDDDLKIELYAKNILDKTPITDAFINSEDTALTTNVFVLDPRLIGLSIKKGF